MDHFTRDIALRQKPLIAYQQHSVRPIALSYLKKVRTLQFSIDCLLNYLTCLINVVRQAIFFVQRKRLARFCCTNKKFMAACTCLILAYFSKVQYRPSGIRVKGDNSGRRHRCCFGEFFFLLLPVFNSRYSPADTSIFLPL